MRCVDQQVQEMNDGQKMDTRNEHEKSMDELARMNKVQQEKEQECLGWQKQLNDAIEETAVIRANIKELVSIFQKSKVMIDDKHNEINVLKKIMVSNENGFNQMEDHSNQKSQKEAELQGHIKVLEQK